MIPTLDRQGAIWLFTDSITKAYLEFAAERKTVLEIAAGYGHVVLEALDAGAAHVFANEIDAGQLEIIRARTTKYGDRVTCCPGKFPELLELADASFDGVYSARLIHFFDGERLRAGLRTIYGWLKPGGKVFLVSDAIYRTIFKPLIPMYESRVAAGEEWPGYFADVRSCIPEYMNRQNFPATMNFLDPMVLRRELSRSGFQVEAAGFYPYTGSFAPGRLDGRELAGAIGVKPG